MEKSPVVKLYSQSKCHSMVSKAIKTGAIKILPCEECGNKAIAHHADYSKPFDITWLCLSHHRR
jgi:hypothetical protein